MCIWFVQVFLNNTYTTSISLVFWATIEYTETEHHLIKYFGNDHVQLGKHGDSSPQQTTLLVEGVKALLCASGWCTFTRKLIRRRQLRHCPERYSTINTSDHIASCLWWSLYSYFSDQSRLPCQGLLSPLRQTGHLPPPHSVSPALLLQACQVGEVADSNRPILEPGLYKLVLEFLACVDWRPWWPFVLTFMRKQTSFIAFCEELGIPRHHTKCWLNVILSRLKWRQKHTVQKMV